MTGSKISMHLTCLNKPFTLSKGYRANTYIYIQYPYMFTHLFLLHCERYTYIYIYIYIYIEREIETLLVQTWNI
jgi:hypothetical protein